MMLCVTIFLFWASFMAPNFYWVIAGKFCYSIFNGPSIALILDIMIRYFKKTKGNEYILVGTSLVGLFKYVQTTLSAIFVGFMLRWKSQRNVLIIEMNIQIMIAISFFSMVAIEFLLKRRGIVVEDMK